MPWGDEFRHAYDATDVDQCQTIGAAASWLGSGGLLAASQRADGHNLIIFIANLDIDDSVEVGSGAFMHPPGPPTDFNWQSLTMVA